MAYFALFCRIIIYAEGIIAVVLNTATFTLLLQKKDPIKHVNLSIWNEFHVDPWSTFRDFCDDHALIFSGENYIFVFYGPLVYLPRVYSDVAVGIWFAIITFVWHLIPASCLIQYLALCKKRIAIAYSPCIIFVCDSMPFYTTFDAPPALQSHLDQVTAQIHDLDETDKFFAYGALLFPTPQFKKSVILCSLVSIFPTYIFANVIFLACYWRILRELANFGVKLSAKTLRMQHAFLRMLLHHTLTPLLLLMFPAIFLLTSIITGMKMDKGSMIIFFFFYALPTVQALIMLSYVSRMEPSSHTNTPYASTIRFTNGQKSTLSRSEILAKTFTLS